MFAPLIGIVEEKDATDAQRKIHEVNAGVYVASAPFVFAALKSVNNDNRQGEYYLPDVVSVGLAEGKIVAITLNQLHKLAKAFHDYWQAHFAQSEMSFILGEI